MPINLSFNWFQTCTLFTLFLSFRESDWSKQMKIQCDVCNKEEASVFCTADEAALCDGCDHRVHHANKLASKHQRFSLLHPSSSKQVPLCDICQEKRAFLFCQQDRAILCRDCDVPIHSANEHTKKHNRFLLTGVKLSALYTSSVVSLSNVGDSVSHQNKSVSVPDFNSQLLVKDPVSASPPNFTPSSLAKSSSIGNATTNSNNVIGDNLLASEEAGSTSSISEYLIDMLPGWHVEDFLDSSSPPFGFCKSDDDCMLPFFDADLENNMCTFTPENLGLWVPQSPSSLYPSQIGLGGQIGFKETKEIIGMKANRRWTDDSFTVPQISPPSNASKRSKRLW